MIVHGSYSYFTFSSYSSLSIGHSLHGDNTTIFSVNIVNRVVMLCNSFGWGPSYPLIIAGWIRNSLCSSILNPRHKNLGTDRYKDFKLLSSCYSRCNFTLSSRKNDPKNTHTLNHTHTTTYYYQTNKSFTPQRNSKKYIVPVFMIMVWHLLFIEQVFIYLLPFIFFSTLYRMTTLRYMGTLPMCQQVQYNFLKLSSF